MVLLRLQTHYEGLCWMVSTKRKGIMMPSNVSLSERHRNLQEQIDQEMRRPQPRSEVLQALKKEKLRILRKRRN